jgi:hypothetical protein
MVAASFLVLLILSRDASAQSKGFSGTGKMVTTQSQTMMFPGDNPGHQMIVVSRTDVFSSADADWNDVQAKLSGFADFTAGTGPHSGYFANTHLGGAQTFVAYQGMTRGTTKPDGSWLGIDDGTFRFVGGTGKFLGITGGGTYKGRETATSVEYEFTGEYTLAR